MIARLILISVLGALLPVAPLFAPSAMAASPASEAVTDAKDAAAQLRAAIGKLAARAIREGRDPSEIQVAFRVQGYQLSTNGGGSANRAPFTGSADQIASDIRRYEDKGVSTLVVDFGGVASSGISDPDQVMQRMQDFAASVWPKV